jgi:hypothetical protein
MGLKFDRIGATFRCRVDKTKGVAKAAIVNRTNFSDDEDHSGNAP